jgi:hypothetical protein
MTRYQPFKNLLENATWTLKRYSGQDQLRQIRKLIHPILTLLLFLNHYHMLIEKHLFTMAGPSMHLFISFLPCDISCGKLEASDGKPALINMILQGQEIWAQNSVSIEAKSIAADALTNSPNAWSQQQIDKKVFSSQISWMILNPQKNKEEQIISSVHLFETLLQFYFRAATKWTASGKSLIRLFKQKNQELAEEWVTAFENLIQTSDSIAVETVMAKILAPHSGYLWDGFRSDAPAEWKAFDESKILDQLKPREPIFHHLEKL